MKQNPAIAWQCEHMAAHEAQLRVRDSLGYGFMWRAGHSLSRGPLSCAMAARTRPPSASTLTESSSGGRTGNCFAFFNATPPLNKPKFACSAVAAAAAAEEEEERTPLHVHGAGGKFAWPFLTLECTERSCASTTETHHYLCLCRPHRHRRSGRCRCLSSFAFSLCDIASASLRLTNDSRGRTEAPEFLRAKGRVVFLFCAVSPVGLFKRAGGSGSMRRRFQSSDWLSLVSFELFGLAG